MAVHRSARDLARGWPVAVLLLVLVLVGCVPARESRQAAERPAPPIGRLAYVADDNHVYTVAVEGGDPRRVDSAPGEQAVAGEVRVSRWPTWTGDGSRLAFMRLRSGVGDAPAAAEVWTVEPDGSGLRRIWESGDLAPIYMAWSPDASALALLAQRREGLELVLVDPAGGLPPRKVAEGNPLYSSWSPDAGELLIHAGGDHRSNPAAELVVVRTVGPEARRALGLQPGDFRAPAWSPDGSRVAVVAEAPGSTAVLAVANATGSDVVRIAPLSEEVAFTWAPGGEHLAFSTRAPGERLLYRGLEVVRTDGSGRAQITSEPVIAFFWSPDGSRLAFAAVDRQAQALAWFVTDATGRSPKQVAQFLPSEEQVRHFAFFDQYAQSHGVWSPDSRYLTYAGTVGGGPNEPAGPRRSRVFVVPADGSAEPRAVVDGNIGIWPARPRADR